MSIDTLRARPARPDDHAHFLRLSRELGTNDPEVPLDTWTREMMPTTLVFDDGDVRAAYAFVQPLERTGYVRHVVIAPSHRGRGLGVAVMRAVADLLRSRRCVDWCLNVRPTNTPAVRLYERCGMQKRFASRSMHLSWTLIDALPREEPSALVRPITAGDDDDVEAGFGLPRGLVASARARTGRVLLGLRDARAPEQWVAMACFDPKFPGAYPFRVRRVTLAAPLLEALRPLAQPEHTHLRVMVEDNDALAALLLGLGAEEHLSIVHMAGALPTV